MSASSGVTQRLHPHLVNLERAWGKLCGSLEPFASRRERPPSDLLQTASELRSAQRELTHDKATLATAEQIATRTDLAVAAGDLHRALTGGTELAYLIAEVIESGRLRVPARAAHQHAVAIHDSTRATSLEQTTVLDPGSPTVAVITPADLHQNRPVPPDQVRDALMSSASDLIQRAVIAGAASSAERAPSTRAHQSTPGERPSPQRSLTPTRTAAPDPLGPAR